MRSLESAGLGYTVVGSTAAAAWGTARMTRDADIVVLLVPDSGEFLAIAASDAAVQQHPAHARGHELICSTAGGGHFVGVEQPLSDMCAVDEPDSRG